MKRTTRTRAGAKRSAAARRPSAGSGMGGKLLIMAALVAAVVFGVAIFFKVGRIEVQGNTIYASDKIIEASGLELGDNLLTVSRATVGGNVKAALPYVDQVSVGRVLPDTVVISVKESQLAFAAATDTNTVWLISPSGKALERIDASLQEQYPQIIGVTLNNRGADRHSCQPVGARRGAVAVFRTGRHGNPGAYGERERGKGIRYRPAVRRPV